MYSPHAVVNNVVEVDKLYVQKLRESIDEMSAIKQNAIMNEDYTTADQMRLKITALQFQLMKMEDQLGADVLTNVITQWQGDFCAAIQSGLSNPVLFPKFIGINILQSPFHIDFLELVKAVPRNYCDSIIRAILIINPQDLPDAPKSPYGWDFVSKKIPSLSLKSADIVDAVKATVTLMVFDIITAILGLTNGSDIRRETHDLILRHGFNYFHFIAQRRMNPDSEGRIFEKIFIRLSVIIGDVASMARRDLYRYTASYLDPAKKISPEETVLVLSSVRYISARPANEDEASALVALMRDLAAFHDKTRKLPLRLAAIQALERLMQSLDYTGSRAAFEAALCSEIHELYKKARKWASNDDERPAALRILVAILVNSRFEFFAQNMDAFLNTDLCPKGKVKPHAYDSILQLLRGRYYADTREHWRQRANGTFEFGRSYGSLTRAPEDQSLGGVANRLNVICELLFFRRKGIIPDDSLDVCSDIVVQIAAHNLQIGLKLVSELMNTQSIDSGPDVFFIGVRALRTIVNPQSGFTTYAFSRNDPNFETIIKDFPFELEINFTHILNYIDLQVGLNTLGTSGQVLDPSSTATTIKQVVPLMGNFTSDQRTQEDILAMLSSAAETASNVGSAIDEAADSVAPLSPGAGPVRPQVGLARTPTARLMRSSLQPGGTLTRVVSADMSSRRDSQFSLLDTYRDSYRRDSQLGLSPLVVPTFTQDVSTKETNEKVLATIKQWFEVCHAENKMPTKYMVTTPLIDQARIRKRAALKLKPEQRLAVRLLKEVIRVLPYIPAPEFIGGSLFIGAYLLHPLDDVASETAVSMRTIFEMYPPLRIGIINGFINYLNSTIFQDDISVCTHITFLAQITKIWVTDFENAGPVVQDSFSRVSCKVDAYLLIALGRPSVRIRKPALQILLDLYTIQQSFDSHQITPREMPLAAILIQMETAVCKQGVYSFLEKSLLGHLLSPRTASALSPLTLLEVASSDFSVLFRHYLGELAQLFVLYGRSKATRHCAKFLRILALPQVLSPPANPSPEDASTHKSYMMLLLALSGVPLVSEIDYNPTGALANSEETLFHQIKAALPQLIANDNFAEVKPVLEGMFCVHRSVIQMLMIELQQCYAEVRHNPAKIMNKRIIDNILYAMRRISQNPRFDQALEDEPISPVATLIDLFGEFLVYAGAPLSDVGFLSTGPVWRLKTAINFCVIAQRFAESLFSVKRGIQRRVVITQDFTELEEFERRLWPVEGRRATLAHIREWYEIVLELAPSMQGNPDARKPAAQRKKLLRKAGLAAEKIMALGNIYVNDSVASNQLTWFTMLESNGYRVFTPEFLYSCDEALGTVLASSYSTTGVHSQVFFEAVFEQILPRLDESPRLHLYGNTRRMSYAEDYFASMHSLPPKSTGEAAALMYPDIRRDDAIKLRQHFGSLLFFGLFNLLNTSKIVRGRSLVFVRELLQMFSHDDTFDIEAYFSGFTGGFYSGVGLALRPKILEISNTTSTLFAADSGSFLWEAVRCYRSAQNQKTSSTLIPTKRWVMELIAPWCRFADFSSLSDDIVNAEFFRFLMDIGFSDGSEHQDYVHTCWSEVAKSSENGSTNTAVMIDVVLQVSARYEKFRPQAPALMTTLFNVHPDQVADALAYHLSSRAFPWRPDGGSPRRAAPRHIKDYIATIEASPAGGMAHVDGQLTNDYTLLCRTATVLTADLLRQNFLAFAPHVPVLINYVLANLATRLQEFSPATVMLIGMIDGFVAWCHETESTNKPEFRTALESVRALMGWFEARDCELLWDLVPPSESVVNPVPGVPGIDLCNILLGIFGLVVPSIRIEVAKEAAFWAEEGYLSSDVTSRTIEFYTMLIADVSMPAEALRPLANRILDQLTVFLQLETEMLSLPSKAIAAPPSSPSSSSGAASPTEPKPPAPPGWDSLSKGKLGIKASSESLIFGIMNVHGILLEKYQITEQLVHNSHLFWPTLGLLHLPPAEFSQVYLAVIENLLFFVQNAGQAGLVSEEFLDTFKSRLADRYVGLQRMLLPALFCKNEQVQARAFEFLLIAWQRLPEAIVDGNPTGVLFTILYTSLWIFAHLYDPALDRECLVSNTELFKDMLSIKQPGMFEDVHRCLQAVVDSARSGAIMTNEFCDELFDRCLTDFISAFVPEYINNIAEFLTQAIMLDGEFGAVSLRMAAVLWRMTGAQGFQNIGSLRNMIRRLPFKIDNRPELLMLYRTVLQDKFEGMPVKDLDFASQGRTEAYPEFDPPVGSVRTAVTWFANKLGIQASNPVFLALLHK
ncbi:hypothetical protein HK105_206608 [Polyrhizophydium stewartii]|uniref:Cell morphogenesis protein N-terminal domain-containing protein n=1 Tax=Polyrhizophydium stewartii TaxID=2732419 RepID=A0ABR4N307_9FUNG